jgi:hypothetical protein
VLFVAAASILHMQAATWCAARITMPVTLFPGGRTARLVLLDRYHSVWQTRKIKCRMRECQVLPKAPAGH